MTHAVTLSAQARRALTHELPETVAAACYEFISGPLADNPRRVGKPLREPFVPLYAARRGAFRVLYDIQEEQVRVHVVNVRHRRDAYRT